MNEKKKTEGFSLELFHLMLPLCLGYLGLELMTSWHGILWSHHTVIVSKGVLFCLHPIFFSHKIVFYKLWFRKHFQINKIYRGAPLPVTLGLPP